jgi:SNF2 family DNA or RNA helicase
MPHSPLDLFAQCRFLDPGVFGPHYTPFKAKYAVLGGFEGRQVIGFKNLDDLEERFNSITYRVKSDDVLDLPETQHVVRWCSLSKKERAIYNEMKNDLIAAIENGIITAANAPVKLIRLQQIVQGSVKDENGVVHEIGNTKENLFAEVLSEIDKDEAVVVFCLYLSDIDRVKRQAEGLGRSVAIRKGGVNEIEKWQEGGADVLAIQIQSGETGIDLTRARYCIFMCGTYNYGNYEQALARLHRPGQTRPVVYAHLMAKDTIDEMVEEAQRKKVNIIESVLAGLTS